MPTPENVKTFGDLCMLAYAGADWVLSGAAPILIREGPKTPHGKTILSQRRSTDPASLYPLMTTLSRTAGFADLLGAARIQILLYPDDSEEAAFWRYFLWAAERALPPLLRTEP
jgi:hypothetical protein